MSKGIIIAAAVALIVGISIGAALFLLTGSEPEAEAVVEEEVAPKAQYFNLRPAVVVNVLSGPKPRMLQADLVLVARQAGAIEAVMRHEPMLRSRVISYFSDLDTAYVQTPEGKLEILAALTELINSGLAEVQESTAIEGVLFNNLVMQ